MCMQTIMQDGAGAVKDRLDRGWKEGSWLVGRPASPQLNVKASWPRSNELGLEKLQKLP